MRELERKYLIIEKEEKDIIRKHLKVDSDRILVQFYLIVIGWLEVRVRKIKRGRENEYKVGIKYGKGGDRKEWSFNISKVLYRFLCRFKGNEIRKVRYNLDFGDNNEGVRESILDVYTNSELRDLTIVEVEFNDFESYDKYKFLKGIGKEVTDEFGFKNKYLYKNINNGDREKRYGM